MIRLALDCFGGDLSPAANIEGALEALKENETLSLVLTGDEAQLKAQLDGKSYDASRIEIVHAPEVIGADEKPTDAIRLKKESSLVRAVRLVRDEPSINGMVSLGSTGALVAAAMLRIGRIENVIRPAFCPIIPNMKGGLTGICDTGANVDVTPEHLLQYALMASTYISCVYGVKNPRVALLNIGTEAEKGDELRKEAYPLLAAAKGINFVGNMEARELLSGDYEVVVCDGFSGNVLIKSTEGACLEMLKMLKRDMGEKKHYKIGALFMRSMFMKEKEFMNYQNYGGSVMLGLTGTVVKGHGSGKASHVKKCIEQACRMETGRLNDRIREALAKEGENV